ncbi:MFS transporter [Amycolatopsis plumensis]|uniref:MFS transporter n=1 Tax=Amycolatopsis plumensis TaxID=236508 RepID=A0ABV5U9C7_9PSEU
MAEVTPSEHGKRAVFGLVILALPTLMMAMDLSILYVAVPALSVDLGANSTEQLWALDLYGFVVAALLITMGNLGDRIGRRRLLLIGASAFAVLSAVAAYSPSIEVLIAARGVLGIAGATLMPSTLALLNSLFTDKRRHAMAIGAYMSCFMGGIALGPVVGGVLLEHFWWGSTLLLPVPVMVLLVVAAPFLLPEARGGEIRGRIDLLSVALSLVAILPFVYGVKEIAKNGLTGVAVVALVVGVLAGVIFVRRQSRLAEPLLDVSLFRNRVFASAATLMLLMGIMSGYAFLVALYLQSVAGYSPLSTGLWLIAPTFAGMVGSMLAPAFTRRIPPGKVIVAGMIISVLGLVAVTQVGPESGVALLMSGFMVASLGSGPAGALGAGLIMTSAPPEKAGSAAAVSETSGDFGVSLGIALTGSIAAAIYRSAFSDPVPGVDVDAASTARESVAGAMSVAQGTPGPAGEELARRAAEAFTDGLNVAAAFGGVVALVLAVVAGISLRHVPAHGDGKDGADDAGTASPTDTDASADDRGTIRDLVDEQGIDGAEDTEHSRTSR